MSRPEIGLHNKRKQMDERTRRLLISEYEKGGIGHRILAKKYGIGASTAIRMIRKSKKKGLEPIVIPIVAEADELPDDVKILKEEIRRLRLKVELQDLIIDISGKELGIDLRKKRGTRQS